MKLRHIIAAAAVTVGCALSVSTPVTAGASVPGVDINAPIQSDAVLHFWEYMYSLQTTVDTCTAYHSNIIGDGVFGGTNPVVNTPTYQGSCLQAFLLVLFGDATYFGYNGNV